MKEVKTRILTQEEFLILQQEERTILREIHRICRKYEIPYYIVGGTLLGAVRHGGFIPWDDDIDIAMYRADYDKFKAACAKELGDSFFLQDIYSDPGYNQLMPKIRKNGTILEYPHTLGLDMHKGVFVDVFMLDYVNKPSKMVEIKHDVYWFFLNLFMRKQCHNIKSVIKRSIVSLIPAKLIVKFSGFIVSGKKNATYTVNYASMYGVKKQTFPSDYYGAGTEIQFDDLTVMAPCKYIEILTKIYGNYMELPPIEKRGIHHRVCKLEVK